jgi:hypothetical protein
MGFASAVHSSVVLCPQPSVACISHTQVFGVTLDPFIVYTSNMFAILSLRGLYSFVATFMSKVCVCVCVEGGGGGRGGPGDGGGEGEGETKQEQRVRCPSVLQSFITFVCLMFM